jgi:hypothetical protein
VLELQEELVLLLELLGLELVQVLLVVQIFLLLAVLV